MAVWLAKAKLGDSQWAKSRKGIAIAAAAAAVGMLFPKEPSPVAAAAVLSGWTRKAAKLCPSEGQ